MLQSINANKKIRILMMAAIALILIKICTTLSLRPDADDQYFLAALNHNGLIDYVVSRYMIWSGRATLEALMILTIGHEWFWKLSIPLTLLLLACSISRISNGKINVAGSFVSLILLSCIPPSINNDAVLWITGYYNYLLPVSAAMYTLSFFLDENRNKYELLAVFVCVFLFSYSEQGAVGFIIASAMMMISHKKYRNKYFITTFLLCLINFIVLMKAPGNYVRLQAETWHWMPEFSEYSFQNKMALGFEKVHQSFVIKWNIPVIVLSTILVIRYAVEKMRSLAGDLSMIVSLFFIIFSVLASLNGHIINRDFFSEVFITAEKWSSIYNFASYFFVMLQISSIITLMISNLASVRNQIIAVSSFLIGCLTVFMVGFSPTVYASLLRVDYAFEVGCILSVMCMINFKKAL